MRTRMGLVAMLFTVLMIGVTSTRASAILIADNARGGDCTTVGDWDAATKTCTLAVDLVIPQLPSGRVDSVDIVAGGITFDCAGHSITGPSVFDRGVGSNGVTIFADGVTVRNCQFSLFRNGVLAVGSKSHNITANEIHDTRSGIVMFQSNGFSTIANNNIHDTFRNGIVLTQDAGSNNVTGNTIRDNFFGVLVFRTGGFNVISANTLLRNARALQVTTSSDNIIENNVFTDNPLCASNVFGDRNKYLSNTFTGNGIEQLVGIVDKQGCLGIESSTQVTVKNNIFTNNASAFGIASGFGPTPVPGGLDHDIDDSNTVNGKKIYYLKGLTNTVINPQTHPDAAAIYCVFCDGVTIEDFVFDSPNSQAVLLGETINSVVRGIFALNYDQGIALDSAANNLITENTVLNQEENFFVFGMTGIRCQGNTITGNSFTSETPAWNFLDLIIDCDDNFRWEHYFRKRSCSYSRVGR